ncbi:MAG TPA: hypothetical protein VNG90_05655 [Candidatus Acidoferrum sp.]|nr:hypothetical protein [Candidatus Acidoferrum sp.]
MEKKGTITINGRTYDPITGMPVGPAKSAEHRAPDHSAAKAVRGRSFDVTPLRTVASHVAKARAAGAVAAHAVHRLPQRSTTLLRNAVGRPASAVSASPAPTPAPTNLSHLTGRAMAAESSKQLKEMLIKERLAEAKQIEQPAETRRHTVLGLPPRLAAVVTCSLAALVLGGYLTFLNLPNLSLRVAAAQAGIAANYPTYLPQGYSFAGPINYSNGAVAMKFAAYTGNQAITIKQQQSSWDNEALLANYVSKQYDSYLTYRATSGLTIYSYDKGAAWVNGGLFYTLNSTDSLSSDQVLRIASGL